MRAYFLTNMYLSPIQRGIQSAHCLHDMFVTYGRDEGGATSLLWTWSSAHKTMIVLNGGTSEDLQELFDFLMNDRNDLFEYPFGNFHEPGIGGALTCVGIVLNQHMVDAINYARSGEVINPRGPYMRGGNPNDVYLNGPTTEVILAGDDTDYQRMDEMTQYLEQFQPIYTKAEWELAKILASKPLA